MPEDTKPESKPSDTKHPEANGKSMTDFLMGGIKLDWIRGAIFKVGGRKMAAYAAAILVVREIFKSGELTWPKAVVCAAVVVVAGMVAFAIAWEDRIKPPKTGV